MDDVKIRKGMAIIKMGPNKHSCTLKKIYVMLWKI